MSAAAWVTFALVGGFVWGGFLCLLAVALRKERGKRRQDHAPEGERGLWVP